MIAICHWIYLYVYLVAQFVIFVYTSCVLLTYLGSLPVILLFLLLASIDIQYCMLQLWLHGWHGQVSHVHDYYVLIPNLSSLWLSQSNWVLISLFRVLCIIPDHICSLSLLVVQSGLPSGIICLESVSWFCWMGVISLSSHLLPFHVLLLLSCLIMSHMCPWVCYM